MKLDEFGREIVAENVSIIFNTFIYEVDEDCNWVTLDSGVHVCIGNGGLIQKGPDVFKGKNVKDIGKSAESRYKDVISGDEEYKEAIEQISKKGRVIDKILPTKDIRTVQPINTLERSKIDTMKTIWKDKPLSIKPIVVRDNGEGLFAYDGNHRLAAAKILGIKKIKVKIAEPDWIKYSKFRI